MNSQQSLEDQLQQLLVLATQNGLYDAADWLKTATQTTRYDTYTRAVTKYHSFYELIVACQNGFYPVFNTEGRPALYTEAAQEIQKSLEMRGIKWSP